MTARGDGKPALQPSGAELLSIIVPVYNEAGTVGRVLDRLLEIDLPISREVIVVDDGSTDATGSVLEPYRRRGDVRLVRAERNAGKGRAVRLGLREARGTILAIQDADLELDPSQLAALVQPILRGDVQVVYGSRFFAGRPRAPWLTILANVFLTKLTNALFGSSLSDMETCYKVMRLDVATALELEADGFDIEPEITAKLLRKRHRIMELPVRYEHRARSAGKKIRWRDGWKAVGTLLRYRS